MESGSNNLKGNPKPKIVIILGPTSSGKSAAAIRLAQELDGEIISADSRQVYRGMDLGTGKVSKDESRIVNHESKEFPQDVYFSEGIRHHLLDVADPNEDFNISHFQEFATKAIEEILAKGKLPIICGGTGFWIDSITKNTNLPEVAPNEKLREELAKRSTEELFAELEKFDPERAKSIDGKNKVRLIRAIEICKVLGKVPKLSVISSKLSVGNYNFLEIGIQVPQEELNEKIKKRLEQRFEQGMITEVENLQENGVSWERLENFGLEYRWIARYLQNKISLEEMQTKIYYDIIHYAKRQMTWFKRNKNIHWLKDYQEIKKEVGNFLKK